MRKTILIILLFTIYYSLLTVVNAGGLRLGMTGAVKEKVKELDKKIKDEQKAEQEKEIGTPPPLKWTYVTEQIYWSSPSIGNDGTIYIGTGRQIRSSNQNALYAINPNGTLKWKYVTHPQGVKGAPAICADGTIYCITKEFNGNKRDTYLYAITSIGTLKWKSENLGQDASGGYCPIFGEWTPAISTGGVIYVSAPGGLYAIDPSTGGVKWKYTYPSAISSPAIGTDGTIYVNTHNHGIVAINPDGTEKWRYLAEISAPHSSPAIGSDGTIYAGRGSVSPKQDQYLYAINPDGTLKWKFYTEGLAVIASPTIGPDNTIYVGTTSKGYAAKWGQCGIFFAINPVGTEKWRYDTSVDFKHVDWGRGPGVLRVDIYSSAAIGADGIIYFSSEAMYLYAFNPDGTIKEKYNFNFVKSGTIVYSSPAITSDGTLYVGDYYYKCGQASEHTQGALYALKTNSLGLANTPWPKIHNNNKNTGRK